MRGFRRSLPAVVCLSDEPFSRGFFFVFCRRFFAGGTAGTISSAASTRRSSGAPVSQRPPRTPISSLSEIASAIGFFLMIRLLLTDSLLLN